MKVVGVGFEFLLEGCGRPVVISQAAGDHAAEGVNAGKMRVKPYGLVDVAARLFEGLRLSVPRPRPPYKPRRYRVLLRELYQFVPEPSLRAAGVNQRPSQRQLEIDDIRVGLRQGRENRESLGGAAQTHVAVAEQSCELDVQALP